MIKERPILMSGPMVRAILDGRKTQTRRVVKIQPITPFNEAALRLLPYQCPYGKVGDRLWVRETWCKPDNVMQGFLYRATSPELRDYVSKEEYTGTWKPSIHMPRAASRLLLEVVSVRVERLHGITASDCRAEGHEVKQELLPQQVHDDAARDWFKMLWQKINGPASWAENPFVWVVEFKRVWENIERLEKLDAILAETNERHV